MTHRFAMAITVLVLAMVPKAHAGALFELAFGINPLVLKGTVDATDLETGSSREVKYESGLAPNFFFTGGYLKNNWSVGGEVGFMGPYPVKSDRLLVDVDAGIVVFGPFFRYYFPVGDKGLRLFISAGLDYATVSFDPKGTSMAEAHSGWNREYLESIDHKNVAAWDLVVSGGVKKLLGEHFYLGGVLRLDYVFNAKPATWQVSGDELDTSAPSSYKMRDFKILPLNLDFIIGLLFE